MSVTLVYFCGPEVLSNPGWIFHLAHSLSPSFSFVSLQGCHKDEALDGFQGDSHPVVMDYCSLCCTLQLSLQLSLLDWQGP